MSTTQNCCCQCPCPCIATATPFFCRRPSNTRKYVWLCLLWGHCSFPFGPGALRRFVCPSVESLFSPIFWKSHNHILLAFEVRFSGDSYSPFISSGWEAWYGAKNFHFSGKTYVVLQFSCSPLGGYGIEFYHYCTPSTISLWLLLCFWMQSIFLGSSSVFLSVVVQQLLVILALSEEMIACPSALASWTNLEFMHFGTVFDLGWPPRLKAGFQFPARDLSQVVAVRALNPNHLTTRYQWPVTRSWSISFVEIHFHIETECSEMRKVFSSRKNSRCG